MTDFFYRLYISFNHEDLFLIFLSIIIGLVIGAEREYKNKAAGLRTLMLVSVGSCTFTILSLKIGFANPDRLAANIVTGIGFLGAGAIFKDENRVNGITTACTIWVMAALGMCIGSGHIYLGMLSAAAVVFVLLSLIPLERWIETTNKIITYRITTAYEKGTAGRFEKLFADFKLRSMIVAQVKHNETLTITWRIRGHKKNHQELTAFLLNDAAIHRIEI